MHAGIDYQGRDSGLIKSPGTGFIPALQNALQLFQDGVFFLVATIVVMVVCVNDVVRPIRFDISNNVCMDPGAQARQPIS